MHVTQTVFNQGIKNAEVLLLVEACNLFQDYDTLFDRFVRECRLGSISKAAGLNMKATNTIVDPWTLRIKANSTQQEFDLLLASGHSSSERYVE